MADKHPEAYARSLAALASMQAKIDSYGREQNRLSSASPDHRAQSDAGPPKDTGTRRGTMKDDGAAARKAMQGPVVGGVRSLGIKSSDHITGRATGYRKTWARDWGADDVDDIQHKSDRGPAITRLPEFWRPISRPIRAATPEGVTSFHFSSTPVAKVKQATVSGHGVTVRPGAAREHSRYLERDGAVARSTDASEAASDIGRAVAERMNAQEGSDYIERQEALAAGPNGDLALLTNISDDPEERRDFWQSVEEHANEPGRDRMTVRPDANPAMWPVVLADPSCPSSVRQAFDEKQAGQPLEISPDSNEAMRKLLSRHGWKPVRKKKRNEHPDAYAAAVADHEQQTGITFHDARGGRIQFRMVGELPHEVSHAARLRIMRGMADPFEKAGLPYTAVMHAPDYANNDKNWHFHLIYHDRPATRFVNDPNDPTHAHLLPCAADGPRKKERKAKALARIGTPEMEQFVGRWNFDVPLETKKKSRNTVTSYPYYQEKLRCVPILNVENQRALLAKLTNVELERAGQIRRVDPRTHPEMGIDREPDEHLSSRRSQLEDAGVPTKMGQRNERRQWDYQMRLIERSHAKGVQELETEVLQMRQSLAARRSSPEKETAAESVIKAYRHCQQAALEQHRITQLLFEHHARSESRAKKVEEVCRRHLEAIKEGKATKQVQKLEQAYRDRLDQARSHLHGLSALLADEIAEIGRSREAAETFASDARRLREEFDGIVGQEIKTSRADGNSQRKAKQVPTQLEKRKTDDDMPREPTRAAAGEISQRILTKTEMDDFIERVLERKVRLVERDRIIVPQVEDAQWAAVVAAANYREMMPRLIPIHRNQIKAGKELLELIEKDPTMVALRLSSKGQQELHLRSPDERLQAALRMFAKSPRVAQAIQKALAVAADADNKRPADQAVEVHQSSEPRTPSTPSAVPEAAKDGAGAIASSDTSFDPEAERKRIADGKIGQPREQSLRRGLHQLLDRWITAREGGNDEERNAVADAIADDQTARLKLKPLSGPAAEDLRLYVAAAEEKSRKRDELDRKQQQQQQHALWQQRLHGVGWN